QLSEGLDEAGEEVALGEEEVDGEDALEVGHHLVDALADPLTEGRRALLVEVDEVAHVHRDEQAVERTAGPVLRQHVEEAEPLVAVVVLGGVAAGGVEDDGLVGEPPFAVPGTGDALHPAAAGGEVGELKTGLAEGSALAGSRRSDDQVPGKDAEG